RRDLLQSATDPAGYHIPPRSKRSRARVHRHQRSRERRRSYEPPRELETAGSSHRFVKDVEDVANSFNFSLADSCAGRQHNYPLSYRVRVGQVRISPWEQFSVWFHTVAARPEISPREHVFSVQRRDDVVARDAELRTNFQHDILTIVLLDLANRQDP